MGFFDKIKEKAQQFKEENKNLGITTKRMNNRNNFYGFVNRKIDNGDFWKGSYINFEPDQKPWVIYSAKEDDYRFAKDDVAEHKSLGNTKFVFAGEEKEFTAFQISFKDGKTAKLEILPEKVEEFTALMFN